MTLKTKDLTQGQSTKLAKNNLTKSPIQVIGLLTKVHITIQTTRSWLKYLIPGPGKIPARPLIHQSKPKPRAILKQEKYDDQDRPGTFENIKL